MRFLLLALFTLCLFPFVSFAQEPPALFEDDPETAEEQIERLLNEQEERPLEIYDYANRNERICKRIFHTEIHPNAINNVCSCVSKRIPMEMTVEQVKAINAGGEEGRFQLGRLMMFVYQPCLANPIARNLHAECVTDNRVKYAIYDPFNFCNCIYERMEMRIRQFSGSMLEQFNKEGKLKTDPISTLLPVRDYRPLQQHEHSVCFKRHHRDAKMRATSNQR